MKNKAIIKALKALLPTYQKPSPTPACKEDAKALRYLMGQIIRQYDIPKTHWHISEGAKLRWTMLNGGNIKDYHYQDTVTCEKLHTPITYELFIGAQKTGTQTTLSNGSAFPFRQMFHEDHVIPVSLILDELAKLNYINETTIQGILNQMHLCVILKEEDRKIGRTKGRSLCFASTIQNTYTPAGVILASSYP